MIETHVAARPVRRVASRALPLFLEPAVIVIVILGLLAARLAAAGEMTAGLLPVIAVAAGWSAAWSP